MNELDKEQKDREFRQRVNELIDHLYSDYLAEISLQNIAYRHPMPKPEPEMTKEEFISKLHNSSYDDRWNTALQSLLNYTERIKIKSL